MPERQINRHRISHELKMMGLAGLDDRNLLAQIAFFIRSHDQLRGILISVEPELREVAYRSLQGRLSFTPKPLDVYIAEARRMAEQQQLPRYDPKTGVLTPMKTGEVNVTEIAEATLAQMAHEKAKGRLTLVCTKCTFEQHFPAPQRTQAMKDAEREGWRTDGKKSWCPKHVPARCSMNLRCTSCDKNTRIRVWDEQDGYRQARLLGWHIGDCSVCPECAAKPAIVQ